METWQLVLSHTFEERLLLPVFSEYFPSPLSKSLIRKTGSSILFNHQKKTPINHANISLKLFRGRSITHWKILTGITSSSDYLRLTILFLNITLALKLKYLKLKNYIFFLPPFMFNFWHIHKYCYNAILAECYFNWTYHCVISGKIFSSNP